MNCFEDIIPNLLQCEYHTFILEVKRTKSKTVSENNSEFFRAIFCLWGEDKILIRKNFYLVISVYKIRGSNRKMGRANRLLQLHVQTEQMCLIIVQMKLRGHVINYRKPDWSKKESEIDRQTRSKLIKSKYTYNKCKKCSKCCDKIKKW